MEPASILLLLVTCRSDLLLCREETKFETSYQNLDQCNEEKSLQITRLSRDGYRVFGKCLIPEDPQIALNASLDWHVSATGELTTVWTNEDAGVSIASDQLPSERTPTDEITTAAVTSENASESPRETTEDHTGFKKINVVRFGGNGKNVSTFYVPGNDTGNPAVENLSLTDER